MSLKLFYLTTEITPFANTSLLGDFSVKVPLSLQTMGHDVRTMIPKYGFVSERKYILREVIRLREIPFEFDGGKVISSAKSAFIPKTRVQVYFLEDQNWFKPLTNLLYKAKNGRVLSDNDIRYAFFNKAAIATLPHLFWKPDIILCNGWQSTFVPGIYKQLYEKDAFYRDIKTVMLVHSVDEYANFHPEAFEKAGINLPSSTKGEFINGFEAAAPYVDLIITLNTPSNNVKEELIALPGIKAEKKKLLSIMLSDDEAPDYGAIANTLNDELVKLYD
ncbi:MAG: glycogen/starch synthase [Fidelibacterota bacterium]